MDFTQLSQEGRATILGTLSAMDARYPGILSGKVYLKMIGDRNSSIYPWSQGFVGETGYQRDAPELGQRMRFNPETFASEESYQATYNQTLPPGFHVAMDRAGTVMHEFAHALDNATNHDVGSRVWYAMDRSALRTYPQTEALSMYALSDEEEAFAEAFVWYQQHGDTEQAPDEYTRQARIRFQKVGKILRSNAARRKDWNEDDHPRDEQGRFTDGDSSDGTDSKPGPPLNPRLTRYTDQLRESDNFRAFAADLKLTPEEAQAAVEAKLAEELDQRQVIVREDGWAAAEIITEGRIKNQYETGDSNGLFSPDVRDEAELNLFGIQSRGQSDPLGHPIYGALERPGLDDRTWEPYGGVAFILKDDVKDVTTFTVGDSLNESGEIMERAEFPTPLSRPGMTSARNYLGMMVEQTGRGPRLKESLIRLPMEAQIHLPGGLTLDHVKAVEFRYGDTGNIPHLRAELRKLGIPSTVIGGGERPSQLEPLGV